MSVRLIGLTGKARSGKDTVGVMLKNMTNFDTYALAAPIKEAVNYICMWGIEQSDGELKEVVDPKWGFSPRVAYQKLGTEWGRELNDQIWLKRAELKLEEGPLVVTDVRFENEADWIRDHGGILIHVVRPDQKEIGDNGHASEAGVRTDELDHTIVNDGSLDDLLNKVRSFVEMSTLT